MKTRSLKAKLLSSYAVCTAILLVVGATGFWGIRGTCSSYAHVVEINMGNAVSLSNLRDEYKNMVIAVSALIGISATNAEVTKSKNLYEEAKNRYTATTKIYEGITFVAGEEALWNDVTKAFAPFEAMVAKVIALSATGNKADDKARDELIATEFATLDKVYLASLDALTKFQQDEAKKWTEKAKSSANWANLLALAVMLAGAFVAIVFGLKISSALTNTLNGVASTLDDNSNQVTSAAQQIASSSEQLSQAATEQAASLEETSASVEEMNSMIKKNTENATRAAEVSDTTQQSATKGKVVVGEMLKAIGEINESNTQISEIVKVIAEIEDKTKVINDIVFKTQLLSFNASVEAARAGAHGKGFAVVAEEVGKLAQLSGNAAREIAGMLSTSVKKVEGLVTTAREKVKVGSDVAQQCGIVLDEIVTNVGTLSEMSKEIAKASEEQAQGVEQVSKAMGQLDQVTQQNAATAEESASAAEELSSQAEALKGVVQTLMQTINGGEDQRVQFTSQPAAPRVAHATPHAGVRSQAKVLHIKNASSKKVAQYSAHQNGSGLKKAVGHDYGDDAVSENDPRFKEV